MAFLTFLLVIKLPERLRRSPSLTIRVVSPKKKSRKWFRMQKNSRMRMKSSERRSMPRMVWKTTASR